MKNVVGPTRSANALLQLMPARDRAELLRLCESFVLEVGAKLALPGAGLDYVFFPSRATSRC